MKDTANMLKILSDTGGPLLLGIMDASEKVDAAVNAEHFGNGHTSHNEQNN